MPYLIAMLAVAMLFIALFFEDGTRYAPRTDNIEQLEKVQQDSITNKNIEE